MLTSFFGKSNPINYFILGIFIFVSSFFATFSESYDTLKITGIIENLLFSVFAVFMMLLLDFIIRKNGLTKNNTYAIFFFSCFLLAVPEIFSEKSYVVAAVCMLFAIRRILTFTSEKNIEKKILDASLWVMFASFFYFWSLLLFVLLYLALFRKGNLKYKDLLIPIVGACALFVLATAINFLISDSFAWFYEWKSEISLNFSAYNDPSILFPATLVITMLLWMGLFRFFRLTSMQKKERPNAVLILIAIVICVFISLASPLKNGSELLFIIGPLAIIITNYLENSKEFWFRELLLWLAALLPISMLFL
ncbi:DUF6427 family protein [Ulvibacter antarcticus]|uniref:Uncharacterized protein n=1 Tax=Ulvibacter antarcticus TaxID=442714 RepID=A0A3L9Z1H6_9FLAO|nr:DUF6427 family protein [Ulvibacter antarcticus]RMA65970.1 hypothetical protein BXY75_0386 [Ulvibacter antarcticus]